jgi:hypothetical protein
MNKNKTLSGKKKVRNAEGLSIAEELSENAPIKIVKHRDEPEHTARPLTDIERAESAQRGFIRRARRATKRGK